jgi:hypothetical protein
MLWYGLYRPLQSGVELGSVLLLSQFNLERGDLLLGLCERGRCAADLRDEFVKGSAVHCSPHSQSPHGDPDNCIAEKVNQRLTLKTAKSSVWSATAPTPTFRPVHRPRRVHPTKRTRRPTPVGGLDGPMSLQKSGLP